MHKEMNAIRVRNKGGQEHNIPKLRTGSSVSAAGRGGPRTMEREWENPVLTPQSNGTSLV